MNNKAQSTFEYILLVTAVIVVVLAFVSQGQFRNKVEDVINGSIDQIQNLTNDVVFDVPESGIAFDYVRPKSAGAPPEGWQGAQLPCLDGIFNFSFLGLDSDGLPIFSDEFVGNAFVDNNPVDYETHLGELKFDAYGHLMIGVMSQFGPGEEWVPFDWKNQGHLWSAFSRQRYGKYWARGSGYQGHVTDFVGYFENVFGREGSCVEVMDHYYGNDRLYDLAGELATFNGLTLWEASYKKNMMEHMFNPDDDSYIGNPRNPPELVEHWNRLQWEEVYRYAIRFGIRELLPFNQADIDAAFPPGT